MNRLLISAAHKSSGKTLISIGLCAAYRNRGMRVSAFKKGPDYIDPLWLGQASGQPCWNLDFFTMGKQEIQSCFFRHQHGADITLVEGNKGLHDGLDVLGSDSNAALATLLDLPVVLVLDVSGITRGVAPLLTGYACFDPQVRIAGVILNRVAGPRQEGKLCAAIEHYTDFPVLGAIGRAPQLAINERHLGLVPENEDHGAAQRIEQIASVIEDTVDLDTVLSLTAVPQGRSKFPLASSPPGPAPLESKVRIGIARDRAFGFYYPDGLAAFGKAGAELVPFDTLNDNQLPEVDGLFIGGGFPECFLGPLSDNADLREAIRSFIEGGGPAYAECGGLMYLTRSIRWQSAQASMVGVIPADTEVLPRPVGRGYMQFRTSVNHPWPMARDSGDKLHHVHEFHYSRLNGLASDVSTVLSVERGYGLDGSRDGIHIHNLLATYAHQRHLQENPWVDAFVAFVRAARR